MAWLLAPQRWKPGTLEPDRGLSRGDAEALAAYVLQPAGAPGEGGGAVSARLRLVAAVASVALALSSAAPSCRRVPMPARDALQEAFLEDGLRASEARGHRVFLQRCATCHGAQGRGDGQNAYNLDPPPPDFQESLARLAAADRRKVVEQGTASIGRSPLCPPWGRSLSGDEIDAVVAWLEVASRPAVPPSAPGSSAPPRRAVSER